MSQYHPAPYQVQSPPRMSWAQAAKVYFLGSSRKTQARLVYTGIRLFPFLLKAFPFLASAGIMGNDVVGFVFDDPAMAITGPWMFITLLVAAFRIPRIRSKNNKQLAAEYYGKR